MSQENQNQETPLETKVTPGAGDKNQPNPDGEDDSWAEGLDEKTKGYIAKLRKENKERRQESQTQRQQLQQLTSQFEAVKGKLKGVFGEGEEGEEEWTPEQKIEMLSYAVEEREAELEFMRGALSLGIYDPADQKYLSFLLNQHMEDKEDGYEIDEDTLREIVADVQSRSKSARAGSGNSSFNSTKPGNSRKEGSGEITLEAFKKMGMTEKSDLYVKNQPLYLSLMAQLKAK